MLLYLEVIWVRLNRVSSAHNWNNRRADEKYATDMPPNQALNRINVGAESSRRPFGNGCTGPFQYPHRQSVVSAVCAFLDALRCAGIEGIPLLWINNQGCKRAFIQPAVDGRPIIAPVRAPENAGTVSIVKVPAVGRG